MSDTFTDVMTFSMLLTPRCEVPNRSGSACRRTAAYAVNMGHTLLACGHHVNARTLYAVPEALVKL